jgi:antitoxin FitA
VAHLQIRNVPPELHRKLKARAAKAGMSLSEYVLAEVRALGELPTPEELEERIRRRGAVHTKTDPSEIIRRDRDAR